MVHRDLYEEKVIGDRLGLIDLDDTARGPPELDVANLFAHLTLLESRRRCDLSCVRDAFLAGYDEVGHGLGATLLDRLRRLTLLRLACIHQMVHRRANSKTPTGASRSFPDPVIGIVPPRHPR